MSSRLREIARTTLSIIDDGGYRSGAGEVRIGAAVAAAVAGTRLYLPDDPVVTPAGDRPEPVVRVTDETTLAATARLGGDLACLVFASARNPGGGFRTGAQAQEESIARASALYPCLRSAGDFYAYHRAHPDLRYSDRVIYSPAVPVFRDDHGTLLPAYRTVSFLTCAAPNRAAIRNARPGPLPDLGGILRRRARRILQVAAAHGHRRLVLGAWGCGVFGNDPAEVAAAFTDALRRSPWFDEVVFAVRDKRPGTPVLRAFGGR